MSSPDRPSARDLNPVQVVAEALGRNGGRTTWLLRAEVAVSALRGNPAALAALAGTPHPGVTRLLARCDEADREAGRDGFNPWSPFARGSIGTSEVRALLGHTTTDTARQA